MERAGLARRLAIGEGTSVIFRALLQVAASVMSGILVEVAASAVPKLDVISAAAALGLLAVHIVTIQDYLFTAANLCGRTRRT